MKPYCIRLFASLLILALAVAPLVVQATKAAEPAKTADKDSTTKSGDSKKTEKAVVAAFRLSEDIIETPQGETLSFETKKPIALKDLIERLQKARDDKNVKAVAITLDGVSIGRAQVEELRQAMSQVREAGKEVYAHADSLTPVQYLLVSGATKVSVVPTGDVWLTGLHGAQPYLRGLLNMIGVTPDFLTCGAYKSAAEMFMREGPSPQAEEMMNWILDGLYASEIKLIARGRGVEADQVRKWIDDGPYTARRAREVGLVDRVEHRQEFEAGIKQRFDGNIKFDYKYGEKAQAKIDFSSPMGVLSFYAELLGGRKPKSTKDAIAIVYVDGPIVLGTAESSPLDPGNKTAASTTIRRALDKAAADDSIKGVVLRVDSPGGSATASEIILNATKRVKAKKPLAVSMGDVAGSGGYYVACGADTIFADDLTITGSIGVVGGKLATGDMWGKIGIKFKEYNRGANADLLSGARPFTTEQRKIVQTWMDEIYGVFKQHVVDIRGDRLKKPIDEIAGGRVYTGRQAMDLGLVDKIGTLDDAVKFVAKEAKLEKYEVRVVPEPKNLLQLLMGSKADDDEEEAASVRFGAGSSQSNVLNAALPYLRNLDQARVEAVLRALRQLETLQQEGVVLMTPEILLPETAK